MRIGIVNDVAAAAEVLRRAVALTAGAPGRLGRDERRRGRRAVREGRRRT